MFAYWKKSQAIFSIPRRSFRRQIVDWKNCLRQFFGVVFAACQVA
jgi:hypothetical protein